MNPPLDVLAEAVATLTAGRGKPRPGQVALASAIDEAMRGRGAHIGEAPTGSGKSLAYLSVALWRAAVLGERTLVTTATHSLQSQVVEKDIPVVADAVASLTGTRPSVAVLKGWANYGCLLAASAVAAEESSLFASDPPRGELAAWVLSQSAEGGYADKAECTVPGGLAHWGAVSMSPAECLGERCPKRSACMPLRARRDAAQADVVVTNHAMLAVQAATSAALLLGDDAVFGPFDHVVVDEAHALVPAVREAAAGRVSAASVTRAARALSGLPLDVPGRELVERATVAAAAFSSALSSVLGSEKVAEVGGVEAATLVEPVMAWVARASKALPRPWELAEPAQQVAASRAGARLERLRSMLSSLASAAAGPDGWARWVEPAGQAGPALCLSPVDVSGYLAANLWGTGETSVVLVSATLPTGVAVEAGLGSTRAVRYPSPLEDAYRRCALYVPEMPKELVRNGQMDLSAHMEWAAGQVAQLVDANGGSALVLAATTEGAHCYGAALRAASRGWAVHVVGDAPAGALVEAWRTDTASVLVGTRGFMEGVDAPGPTCNLVVVDRVPRSAPNPVDDARVSAISARLGCDRWVADGLVYVADAALLLKQATGRLVRRESDSGLLAVLDPRLRRGPWGYRGKAASAYADALKSFPPAVSPLEAAVEILSTERARDDRACARQAAPAAAVAT